MLAVAYRAQRQVGCLMDTMKAKTNLFILLALIALTGCNSPKQETKVSSSAPANNLNSRGLQKLTPAQVEEKIKAVQANPAIPDTAKPKVIESIRAQGEP